MINNGENNGGWLDWRALHNIIQLIGIQLYEL